MVYSSRIVSRFANLKPVRPIIGDFKDFDMGKGGAAGKINKNRVLGFV